MAEDNAKPRGNGEIDLASVLNILWRRRFIVLGTVALGLIAGIAYGVVVTPLYRATATIRPGITAFTPAGGGDREWRLKDVQRWFGNRLYRDAVSRALGSAPGQAPIIDAEFAMRGLQNIQGGNVVTLSVLDPSPEQAKLVLETALDAFEDYATADTLSNSIALTKRGLYIQIAERRRLQRRLAARLDSLEIEIGLARDESLQVYKDLTIAEAEIGQIRTQNELLQDRAESFAARKVEVDARLAELARARVSVENDLGRDTTTDTSGLRPGLVLTETEVYRALVNDIHRLQGRLFVAAAREDSMRRQVRKNEDEIVRIRSEAERDVEAARIEVASHLASLRFARDVAVPAQMQSLDMQILERQAQLVTLSPLERIGRVMASENPVRPRRQRAVLILTFLGLIGGIVLAYVVDYGWNHRGEIFRD